VDVPGSDQHHEAHEIPESLARCLQAKDVLKPAQVDRDKLQNRGIDFCGRCERPAHGLMLPDYRLDLPRYGLE
jgi:hypothetical protein